MQTEKVWGYAEEYGLARLIVVNRMDRENASFERALETVQTAFGRAAVPVAVPVGEEKAFKGIVDLVSREGPALRATTRAASSRSADVPAAQQDAAKAWREKLVEMVAESNEELMEEFFEKGTLSQEQLAKGLRQRRGGGQDLPRAARLRRCCNVGVHALLDAIVDLLPSPADRGEATGQRPRHEGGGDAQARGRRAALGVRVQDDRGPARRPHQPVPRLLRHAEVRLGRPQREPGHRRARGLAAAAAGQGPDARSPRSRPATSARWRSSRTRRPATRWPTRRSPIVYPPVVFPEPATTFAIEPKTRGDDDKISTALQRLLEEDPVLRVSRDAQTHEMLLSGMGQLHIEVVVGPPAQALQGRGQPQEAEDPLPRDDQGPRPRPTGATRSRPAATASSATAGSA